MSEDRSGTGDEPADGAEPYDADSHAPFQDDHPDAEDEDRDDSGENPDYPGENDDVPDHPDEDSGLVGWIRDWLDSVPVGAGVAGGGVVAGLIVVGAVWLSERGCEAARETPNCGSLGLPLLLLAVAAGVVVGNLVLRQFEAPRALLTAFLGICFMGVVVLTFLAERLFTPWMLVVVPLITAATYWLAHLLARSLRD